MCWGRLTEHIVWGHAGKNHILCDIDKLTTLEYYWNILKTENLSQTVRWHYRDWQPYVFLMRWHGDVDESK